MPLTDTEMVCLDIFQDYVWLHKTMLGVGSSCHGVWKLMLAWLVLARKVAWWLGPEKHRERALWITCYKYPKNSKTPALLSGPQNRYFWSLFLATLSSLVLSKSICFLIWHLSVYLACKYKILIQIQEAK